MEEDDDYDTLVIEYEEHLEELSYINSLLDFPLENEPPHIVKCRESLLKNIRELRSRLCITDRFDSTMGYDPFKVYRLDFLFRK